jgi:outer membrane protein OmpA-like peptidoglycan-associated protein
MSRVITSAGHVAFYGISFDSGKADPKSESTAALTEIGRLLTREPSLSLLVVGHTDSTGEYAANLLLSDRRAKP